MTKSSEVVRRAKEESWAERLLRAGRRVNQFTLSRLDARGLSIRPAHTALFPHIDLTHGTRPSELARRMGISKQAVGQLVDEMVREEILERRPDPDDGRAQRVCFSQAKGRTLLDGLAWLREAEAELEGYLEPEDVRHLRVTLDRLLAALDAMGAED